VLTPDVGARAARLSTTRQTIRATMRIMREKPIPSIVNIARSACGAGVFVIHAFDDRRANDVIANRRRRPKARCADSESRFLAIKIFSCSPASRLILARQNRFFARVAAADSGRRFFVEAMHRRLW
jgi:hypothetical protein